MINESLQWNVPLAYCFVRVSDRYARGPAPGQRRHPTICEREASRRREVWGTVTVNSTPPSRCLRSSGVPAATMHPLSRMATRSASSSPSSRYCVVRKIALPSARRERTSSHSALLLWASGTVVGSSRNNTWGGGGAHRRDRARGPGLGRRGPMGPDQLPSMTLSRSSRNAPAERTRAPSAITLSLRRLSDVTTCRDDGSSASATIRTIS
jgi:hypothetical protein